MNYDNIIYSLVATTICHEPSHEWSSETHLYNDILLDSLDRYTLVTALEDEFNIHVLDEAKYWQTLGDVCASVNSSKSSS